MVWQRDEERSYAVSWFVAACTFAAATAWAVWDAEITRAPWIDDQRAFFALDRRLARQAVVEARRAWAKTGAARGKELLARTDELHAKLATPELVRARSRLGELDTRYADAETDFGFARSDEDEAYYLRMTAELRLSTAEGAAARRVAEAAVRARRAEEERHAARAAKARAQMERIDAERAPLRARLAPIEEALAAVRRERAALRHDIDEAEARLRAARARSLRDVQVQQVVVRWRQDGQGKAREEVDRCATCHLGVDRPGFEDPDAVPRSFRTHPERAWLLGAHPVERFGCTACHQGQGRSTEATTAHARAAPFLDTGGAAARVSWAREGDPYWEEPLLGTGRLYRTRIDARTDELEVALGADGEPRRVTLDRKTYETFEDLARALEAKLDAAFAPAADATEVDTFRVRQAGSRVVLEVVRRAKAAGAEPPSPPELRVLWPDDALRGLLGFAGPLAGASRHVAATAPEPIVGAGSTTGRDGLQVPVTARPAFLFGAPFVESACLRCHRASVDLRPTRSVAEQATRYSERRLEEARAAAARGEAPPEGAPPAGPDPERLPDLAPTLSEGRALYRSLNCAGCHVLEGFAADRSSAPPLDAIGDKVDADFLWTWLRDPRGYRPGTRMPTFWPRPLEPATGRPMPPGSAEVRAWERRRDDEATAIVAFLRAVSRDGLRVPAGYGDVPGADAEEGRRLFETKGCRGCHVTEAPEARPGVFGTRERDRAPNLSRIGAKTNADWLTYWIEDPARTWSATRMPNLRLTRREAASIARWLATLTGGATLEHAPAVLTGDAPPAELVERGRALVADYGCHGCHAVPGLENAPPVGPELDDYARKDPTTFDFAYAVPDPSHQTWAIFTTGKLDAPRIYRRDRVDLKMPDYELSAHEIRALLVFLAGTLGDRPLDALDPDRSGRGRALDEGRQIVEDLNCRGCHVIDGRGGDIRAFSGSEPEALALLPPVLRAEGFRVQPEWLYGFLRQPAVIRPWIQVAMPTFGLTNEEAAAVVRAFAAQDDQPYPYERATPAPMDPERWRAADALFKELQCQSCHVLGDAVPEGADPAQLAPDLARVPSRLRPTWIRRWLENPELLQPGTRMPSYWPEPYSLAPSPFAHETTRTAQDDMELLTEYLMTLGTPPPETP